MPTTEARRWRLKGPEMEGPIARWYARIRGSQSQLDAYEKQAALITAGVPSGARVLEVAPGPGYLAIAFKNFALPRRALAEMHRVLRDGGTAVIQDMSRDASHADIDREVDWMSLGWLNAFTTKATLEMLKRRAYAPTQFERLASQSPFGTCDIRTKGIGLEVRLTKEEER